MDKDQILEKSRNENKERDLFGKEVIKEGGYAGAIAALVLAAIFFLVQVLAGKGLNYGLYAIAFSFSAAAHIVAAVRVKRPFNIVLAVVWMALVLLFSVAHIYGLVTASPIL